MPPTRHVANQQSSPISPIKQQFEIPNDHHLLITTPSTILAWDTSGLNIIFRSSKGGIVAARETKDGSGILAVANKHVVVLHDTKRGQERSWGLTGDDDEVRHLEYTQDSKCLFLSTSLTSNIQRYSVERSRLLSPTQFHTTAPVALAVSITCQSMVTASDDPPVIYLKNLANDSTPVLIEPRASKAAVSAAAFHPERANVFLLAFKDGVLAAYDTTKISRKRHDLSYTNQELVNDGEISHLTGLHRTTSKTVTRDSITSKTASIAGAAFLPGYKTRAVTVGSDGRCRFVDFAEGGVILRTWHAKAPLTSVGVLSLRDRNAEKASTNKTTRTGSHSSATLGGPTSTNNLIAVGRADGKIHVYDSVGLLLAQKTVNDEGGRVISVEWVKGPSPHPVITAGTVRDVSDAPTIPSRADGADISPALLTAKAPESKPQPRKSSTPRNLDLHPALRRPDVASPKRSARRNTHFVIHPDEIVEGTVKHTPSPEHTSALPATGGHYLDLFSPVKAVNGKVAESHGQGLPNSPRSRPRLSSQTFVKSVVVEPAGKSGVIDKAHESPPVRPPQFQAPNSSSDTAGPLPKPSPKVDRIRRVSTNISPYKKRRTSFKAASTHGSRKAGTMEPTVAPNENAKVLADLRNLTDAASNARQGSVLGAFAIQKAGQPSAMAPNASAPHRTRHAERQGIAAQKAWHPGNVLERESTWPTDSVQDESLHEHEDDIWLTDESDKEARLLQRRRLAPVKRSFARQTSRSRADDNGTISTQASPMGTVLLPMRHTDGSTEDDMYNTARTHLSPDGALSPSSSHIRELFPRTSSVSPRRLSSPTKRTHPALNSALREVPGNATLRRQAKSPWAKAKAKKDTRGKSPSHQAGQQPLEGRKDRKGEDVGLLRSPGVPCLDCTKTSARVSDLEDEVARLKGEVLALKAALRRGGMPLPPSLRITR